RPPLRRHPRRRRVRLRRLLLRPAPVRRHRSGRGTVRPVQQGERARSCGARATLRERLQPREGPARYPVLAGPSPVRVRHVGVSRYDPGHLSVCATGGTMRRTILPAAILLLAGAAVGCSSDTDDKPTVSKATDTPTTSSSSPSPSPSPSPETYKVGATIDIEASGDQFAVTVIAFKDKGITTDVPGLLNDGEKWAQAEVKVCNSGSESFGVSPAPWSLAYEDGARVDATSISGAELPAPEYPI